MSLDPLGPVKSLPNLRATMDVGHWPASRFVLAGGQSGNPYSPHYADLFELWQKGDGVPIAFTEAEVRAAAVAELKLDPGAPLPPGGERRVANTYPLPTLICSFLVSVPFCHPPPRRALARWAAALARFPQAAMLHQRRACAGAACTLVFLDGTRSHARRWCSMAVCGNRAKAAAHRARARGPDA